MTAATAGRMHRCGSEATSNALITDNNRESARVLPRSSSWRDSGMVHLCCKVESGFITKARLFIGDLHDTQIYSFKMSQQGFN
jgi:hypothetical protein